MYSSNRQVPFVLYSVVTGVPVLDNIILCLSALIIFYWCCVGRV